MRRSSPNSFAPLPPPRPVREAGPAAVTRTKQFYVDMDVDHGPSYGQTLFWAPNTRLPPYEHLATVQFDVNTQKFYDLYIKLMTEPLSAESVRRGASGGR